MSSAEPIEHLRAFELLPWLVNGRLSAAEREAVELHARTCITCRREIREQERLLAALQAQPTVHLSEQSTYDRLSNEIDGRQGPTPREPRYAPLLRFGVVAMLGVALVGFLFWLAPNRPQTNTGYTTLATEPAAQAQLDLIFTNETTAAEMQALLDSLGAEIVAGPSEIGRYGIRLTGDETHDADVAQALERLGKDPHVRFAARALADNPQ